MPNRRAVKKCPHSCSSTRMHRTRRSANRLERTVIARISPRNGGETLSGRGGGRARRAIGVEDVLDGSRGRTRMPAQGLLDDGRDVEERQPPLEEALHGDLVGGVEDGGRGPAGGERLVAQIETGERLPVGTLELEPSRG